MSKKVLVVDDDVVWLTVVQAWLKLAGYEVIGRGGSIGTLGAVKELRPDFVLLDVNMPGLNGDALASLIAHQVGDEGPGVVLCSGKEIGELQERAESVGALGAIKKVADRHQFLAEVDRIFSFKTARA